MILVITTIMNQTLKQPIGVAYGIYDRSVINSTKYPFMHKLQYKEAYTLCFV